MAEFSQGKHEAALTGCYFAGPKQSRVELDNSHACLQRAGSVSDDRRIGLVRYLPEVNEVVFVVDMVPEFLRLHTVLDADCEKA